MDVTRVLHFSAFVFITHFTVLNCKNDFLQREIRQNVYQNTKKNWFRYVLKMTELTVVKNHPLHFMPYLIEGTLRISHKFKVIAKQVIYLTDSTLKEPIGKLELTEEDSNIYILNRILLRPLSIKYIVFKLSKQLRIRLSFEVIYFSSYMSTGCHFGNLTILSILLEQVFCGQHPSLDTYPPSTKVLFRISTEGFIFYDVRVFFLVMDDKIIESVHRIFDKNSVKEQTKLDFWFRKSGGYLRRYHITAKMFQYIILSVLQVKDNAYFLYDGPDTKSRRLKSKGEI